MAAAIASGPLALDIVPDNAASYGPVPADDATRLLYIHMADSTYRWAGSADTPIRYALGHHTFEALTADAARRGRYVAEYHGTGWEACYRHRFECPDPGGDSCTCNPEQLPVMFAAVVVAAGTANAYPITAVTLELLP